MRYLIWSNEHGAWWRFGSLGYTLNIRDAGRYTKEHAEELVSNAGAFGPDGTANEVAILAPEERWQGGPPEPLMVDVDPATVFSVVLRAVHDVDCDAGSDCKELLNEHGRYGRYAASALVSLGLLVPLRT